MSIVTINGKTDEDLNLVFTGIGALWSGPGLERVSTSIISRYGAAPALVARGREKRVPASLKLSGTMATRRTNFNAIMRHLDGMLHLEWSDAPGLMQWARIDAAETRALYESQAYVLGELSLALEFIIDSAVYFDKAEAAVGVTSTASELIGLGTLPCAGIFYFAGATTSLVLTYKHGLTRETITTLTLSGNTGAGTVLIVDCARETLYTWDTTTGVLTSVIDTLYSSGDFPVFDPGDGDADNLPTIECNGSHVGEVHYRGVYA